MSASKPGLTIGRRLKASPARDYAAWTRPELMARGRGPEAGPVLSAETDPRGRQLWRSVPDTGRRNARLPQRIPAGRGLSQTSLHMGVGHAA